MRSLISTLRGFCNAGTDDFTLGGQTYWSDEQLQQILDRYRVDIREAELQAHVMTASDGTSEYKEYTAYPKFLETTVGGTARFIITDGIGSVIPLTSYTPDYENGLVIFDDDQGGSARYLTGHSYDVYAGAADVWEQKAAYHAEKIDFSTDGHSIKRSHILTHCQNMAQKYNGMSISGGSSSADVIRGDYNGA
jgi:hypothetical protein